MSKVKLVKHIPLDEMKLLIRKEKNKHVHERLLFICQLYFGDSFREARTRMCISEQTAYDWLKRWNEKGYDGLVPGFGGGRPPELNKDNKEQLKKMLREKNNWLTSEIRALIRKEFNVSHTERHVSRILRSLGMNYAKPYPTDYRQPRDAEERLKQSIEDVLDSVPDNCVVGFFDEASPQTTDNKQRFWSFGKPGITMNTTKYRANTFGFYPMNGKEVVEFMDHSKSQNVCDFLRKISDKNKGKHIVVFLDNARSHIAKQTRKFARSLNITLVFIPPYSPKYNPIEFIWKSIRRKISQIFVKSEWSFKETIRSTFHRLAKSRSFARGWMDKFGSFFPGLFCP